jgi:hypothetical protein
MKTTVKMHSMLALGGSQRRVRAPGLQGQVSFIPGGELLVMATPWGSAVAEASASAKPTADRMADREGELSPVAESAYDSSGQMITVQSGDALWVLIEEETVRDRRLLSPALSSIKAWRRGRRRRGCTFLRDPKSVVNNWLQRCFLRNGCQVVICGWAGVRWTHW